MITPLTHLIGRYALCLLLLLSSPLLGAPLLLVADDWCPYNCAEHDPRPGYLVELLQRIFARAGISSDYRVVPWSRAIKMVEQNQAGALLATTAEITPHMPMSNAFGETRTCFFARRDSTWQYQGIDELRHWRLGVIQDYDYDGNGPLARYIASSQPSDGMVLSSTGADALHNNLNKLRAGRVDVVVENCNVGTWNLHNHNLESSIRLAGNLEYYHGALTIGFSPSDPQTPGRIALINQGLSDMRRSGELAALLESYGLQDWAPLTARP